MADYNIAYPKTAAFEGGKADVPGDNGGFTYCGITEKNYPDSLPWAYIRSKNLKNGDIIPELADDVKAFYKKEFWDKIHGDQINNQLLAEQTYDFAVNAGVRAGVKMVQSAAGVAVTGIMDVETIEAINKNTIA